MNCPICNNIMLVFKKQGIEEEYCPQCNEFWPSKSSDKKSVQSFISLNHNNREGYVHKTMFTSRLTTKI